MRLSDDMNFPHPVLANWRADHIDGVFDAEIAYKQDGRKEQITIHCDLRLNNVELEQLLDKGGAAIGVFVLCVATGLRELLPLVRGSSTHGFRPGALLGPVVIRPLVWSTKAVDDWHPRGINAEFPQSFALREGEILAIGEELRFEIGNLPLPNIETIFSIAVQEDLAKGEFDLNMQKDKITILASRETYDLVESVRLDSKLKAIAMNAVYVPVVMQVLSVLKDEGPEAFEGRRWLAPFCERCEKLGVDLEQATNLFRDAVKLLDHPFHGIAEIQPERS